jgi:hypothetical protein
MKYINGLLVILLASLPLSAQAGLMTDVIDMYVSSAPDQTNVFVDDTVEGSFNFGSDESIDINVSDTSINIVAFNGADDWAWQTDPVTVLIDDLDFGSPFTIVTSETINEIGFITWDYGTDFISATFAGSADVEGTGVILDIQADLVPSLSLLEQGPTSVPEPGTLALMLLGVVGLFATKRRSC